MSKTAKKLNKKQIATMKDMYMKYTSISEIARTFNVARNTVSWHVNTNAWEAERRLQESEVFAAFDDSKKVDFVKMTQAAATIMSRSLEELATRHEPPSINEATRAADILKTLDNILRLDDNKPTEITQNTDKPMDEKELREKLAKDPFSKVPKEGKDEKLN